MYQGTFLLSFLILHSKERHMTHEIECSPSGRIKEADSDLARHRRVFLPFRGSILFYRFFLVFTLQTKLPSGRYRSNRIRKGRTKSKMSRSWRHSSSRSLNRHWLMMKQNDPRNVKRNEVVPLALVTVRMKSDPYHVI